MGLTYKNIIVAIDGSDEADWAFKKAIEVTKRNKAALHILHIYELRAYPSDAASIKERAEKFGNQLLGEYLQKAKDAGLENVSTVLEFGSPKVDVSKKAEKKIKADLIICGKTGLNSVEHMFIGSVSENIVRSAHCDVLVVKTQKDTE